MTDLPSPSAGRLRQPRWLNGRLVAGMLLVLLSVTVGAKVVAQADRSEQVWAASRDLSAGATLGDADLTSARVRLLGVDGAYLSALRAKPVGDVLQRGIGRGELLAASAVLPAREARPARHVTVPVNRYHAPPGIEHGQRVDVYVTARGQKDQNAITPARLVVRNVPVEDTTNAHSGRGTLGPAGDDVGVVLAVDPDTVPALVAAAQGGALDLIRVPQDRDAVAGAAATQAAGAPSSLVSSPPLPAGQPAASPAPR